ncbi:hypothetical protein [Streptomyces goshikiensis]|uniref:hypothetical protein n=1 Tax=Streptomyces goshikiensis TaxID=1942 RepID=UPI0022F39A2B|nr:hypothetical protein [Streptomyces goshikiensis]WBY18548.1 hypothetical protein PET44_02335 [Streptomyces goshikiensis]
MTGAAGSSTTGARPKEIETAWLLTLAAVVGQAVVWVLGSFVVDPTGLDDMTSVSGAGAAARQLALSGGVLAVVLAVAVKMRAGRAWARAVLAVAGALCLVAAATDFSMSGTGPAAWPLLACLPDLLTAAAVVPMFLPAARTHFQTRPRRA